MSSRKDLLDKLVKTYEDLGQSYERLNHKQVGRHEQSFFNERIYMNVDTSCFGVGSLAGGLGESRH